MSKHLVALLLAGQQTDCWSLTIGDQQQWAAVLGAGLRCWECADVTSHGHMAPDSRYQHVMKLVRDTSTTFLTLSFSKNYRSTIYLNEEPFSDDINSVSCAKYAKPLFCDYIGCFVNDLFSLLKSLPLQPLHWRPCLLRQIMCHFFQLWVLKLLPHAYF